MAIHVVASTTGGLLAGALLGWLGHSLLNWMPEWGVWGVLFGLSTLLVLREHGWVRFPLPQWRRQTGATWYRRFGPLWTAWWWGLDLGSGLTNFITFSGYWVLVVAIVLHGSGGLGALVLGSYGLGRAVALLAAPILLRWQSQCAAQHLDEYMLYRPAMHRWHRYGMVLLVLMLIASAVFWREGGVLR